jgi:membrane protease YdiL (CAAX protease family)
MQSFEILLSIAVLGAIFGGAAAALGTGVKLLARDGLVRGPSRPPGEGVWPLWISVLVAIVAWPFAAGLAMAAIAAGRKATELSTVETLTAALLGQLIAGGIVVGVLAGAPGRALRAIGAVGGSFRGLATLLAIALVVPLTLASSSLTQVVYKLAGMETPAAHQLLLSLDSAGPLGRLMLIASAVVVAPLFEELVFRGCLQSALRWTIAGWWGGHGSAVPPPLPMATVAAIPPASTTAPAANEVPAAERLPYAAPQVASPARGIATEPVAGVAARWVAILLASAAFAGMHEAWMIPPIFTLSVALGVVYERYGSLWSCVLLHAAFNAVSTTLFLLARGAS